MIGWSVVVRPVSTTPAFFAVTCIRTIALYKNNVFCGPSLMFFLVHSSLVEAVRHGCRRKERGATGVSCSRCGVVVVCRRSEIIYLS